MKKLALLATLALTSLGVVAQEGPVMGWSSWNTFGIAINEQLINEQADAMVKFGLKDAGYQYINIDDGYFGLRDDEGNLLTHPKKFPNGLSGIVKHVHGLGLKAGIYSDAGDNTCASGQGSADKWGMGVGLAGHEAMDCAFFFNQLGFDFIKVDFCGGNHMLQAGRSDLSERQRYTDISNAIKATGCKVSFNVCRWAYPGTWISSVSDSWRTTGDITNTWKSVKGILAENLYLAAYSSYGHYNDMDMLEIGRDLSAEEEKTHFGMWCIMNSPLLIGCDMRTIPQASLELMKNKELIALNQDKLGEQAYVAAKIGSCYILVRDVQEAFGKTRAVAIYNPEDEAADVSMPLSTIDLAGKTTVRDLYEHKDLKAVTNGTLVASVPAHGCRIYLLKAAERLERTMYEAETGYISDYQELENNRPIYTGIYEYNTHASSGLVASYLGNKEHNDLRFQKVYSKQGGEYTLTVYGAAKYARNIFVEVNGKKAGVLSCQSSSTDIFVGVSMKVTLKAGVNEIRLYNAGDRMPNIDYMKLEK